MWSEQLGIFHSPNFSGGLCRASTLAFAGRAEALEEPLGFGWWFSWGKLLVFHLTRVVLYPWLILRQHVSKFKKSSINPWKFLNGCYFNTFQHMFFVVYLSEWIIFIYLHCLFKLWQLSGNLINGYLLFFRCPFMSMIFRWEQGIVHGAMFAFQRVTWWDFFTPIAMVGFHQPNLLGFTKSFMSRFIAPLRQDENPWGKHVFLRKQGIYHDIYIYP